MAITHFKDGWVRANKGSGSTSLISLVPSLNVEPFAQAGDILLAWIVFDNTSATTPTVVSIEKPSFETNDWTLLAEHDSPVSNSGGGVRGELWGIELSQSWSGTGALSTYGITVSEAVVASANTCATFRGGSLTLRGSAGVGASSASCAPEAGDLVFGGASSEANSTLTGDSDTTNGSWSTILTAASSGGGSASNAAMGAQWKIPTGSGTQTFQPTTISDGGVVVVALQPFAAPPNAGSASGAHAWTGTALSGDTAQGSATGAHSWGATASGTAPLLSPTFEHWFAGASSATHGYIEQHFKAESFERVIEVQRKPWGSDDSNYATVHTSGTIAVGEEYVAEDGGFLLTDNGTYQYRARQSTSSPAQTSVWVDANPGGPSSVEAWLGDAWLSWLEVFDNGITYDAISGVVTLSGYEHYFSGNGYKADDTTNNWFEGRSLHAELDAVSGEETVYLSSVTSLRKTRFCQLNLNNKIYIVGAELAGAYTTAVYAFNGSGWSTSGNPALPTAQAWVAAAIGTKVYAIGANNAFRVWDTAGAASWATLTYSGSSAPHWVAAVGGKLYVYCQDGSFKSYDPGTATWTTGLTAPSSPYLTSNLASNPIGIDANGRIYLWGGRTATAADHDYSNALWHYDVAADAWGSDQTVNAGSGSHATLTYSAHWRALIIGTYRISSAGGANIGNSRPDMVRPIEPGAVADGFATGSVSWTGITAGSTQRAGSATGAHAWTGVATSEGLKQGAGAGAATWSGTATGQRAPTAVASGAASWSALANGVTARAGAASGVVAWVTTGAGEAPLRAMISAGVAFSLERAHSHVRVGRFFRGL